MLKIEIPNLSPFNSLTVSFKFFTNSLLSSFTDVDTSIHKIISLLYLLLSTVSIEVGLDKRINDNNIENKHITFIAIEYILYCFIFFL